MSFYCKVGEKRYTVHWSVFVLFLIAFVSVGGFFAWCLFGGLYKFGGIGLCLAWILAFGELSINDRLFTMIENTYVRHAISIPCTIAAIIYYFV